MATMQMDVLLVPLRGAKDGECSIHHSIRHCCHCRHWRYCIVANESPLSQPTLLSPMTPMNNHCHHGHQLCHLKGANGDFLWRHWMSPLATVITIDTTHRMAIDTNGCSIGTTKERQWRKMFHSPLYKTLLPRSCTLSLLVKLMTSPSPSPPPVT